MKYRYRLRWTPRPWLSHSRTSNCTAASQQSLRLHIRPERLKLAGIHFAMSDVESLLQVGEESYSESRHLGKKMQTPRSHPRLTVYRLLFFGLTAGFGAVKAVFSYQGQSTVPTTFDWIYRIVVVTLGVR
ncbi:hypothetical protein C8R47DRAFT_1124729 [Mycena vitilis]|nr:hypothetical protein C8R47DRAFT_1124729 [Mycena vitilis]